MFIFLLSPKCSGQNKTTEEVKIEIKKIHGDNIILDRFEYKGRFKTATFGCKKHGYWNCKVTSLLVGSGCPQCGGKNKTTSSVKKEIEEIHKGRILLDKFEYSGVSKIATFGCIEHGYWEAKTCKILIGHGCRKCRTPKGELKFDEILRKMNINNEWHPITKDCKNPKTGRILEFDFYTPDFNLFSEYDGEYHFIIKKHSSNTSEEKALENFNNRQYLDQLKNEFCRLNKQRLLRIHYKDFKKMEEILVQVFEILSKKEYDKTKNSTVKLFNSTLFLNVV